WNLFFEEVWKAFFEKGWKPLSSSLVIEVPTGEMCRVLHIIANPVLTTAGLRLEIKDRVPIVKSKAEQAQSSRSGQLIEPAKLPFDRMWLLILQAEPTTTTTRTASDREQMALLRICANDALAAGAPAILTIPPLPVATAERALRQLSRGLGGSSPP